MARQTNLFKDVDIRKLPVHSTPVGVAASVFILKPSTDYDPDGQYFVRLRYKSDSVECRKLVKLIDDAREEAYKMAYDLLETPKEKKNLKKADASYKEEEDDDGNLTGWTVFNFKRKATRIDAKSGATKSVKLPIYDNVLNPLTDTENMEIWSGSELSIAYKLCPFYTEKLGAGVSHRLEAVQVLKAVSSGGTRDGADFGFKARDEYSVGTTVDDADSDEDNMPPVNNKRPINGDDGDY